MCGIVGYVGAKNACEIVVRGLERLEYRGYDSAGVAVCEKGAFRTVKTVGKVAKLKELVGADGLSGNIGIGHTRWATHGGVTTANAHPHTDEKHTVVLVHNGIIENYKELRDELVARTCTSARRRIRKLRRSFLPGSMTENLSKPCAGSSRSAAERLPLCLFSAIDRMNSTA